jgi:hypothetical protein
MIRVALSISIFFILSQVCYGQDQSPKYYCPPCNCIHDGKLFDKPGVCPDPQCGMQLLPVQGNYSESKLKYIVTFLRNNWLIRLYDILILPAIIQGFIFKSHSHFSRPCQSSCIRFSCSVDHCIIISEHQVLLHTSCPCRLHYKHRWQSGV